MALRKGRTLESMKKRRELIRWKQARDQRYKDQYSRRYCLSCKEVTTFTYNKMVGHSECTNCAGRRALKEMPQEYEADLKILDDSPLKGLPVYDPVLSGNGIICHKIEFVKEVNEMADWASKEKERISITSASRFFEVGKKTVFVMNSEPDKIDTEYGEMAIFIMKHEGTEYKVGVRLNTPLYASIVEVLSTTKEGEYTEISVTRTGEEKETRYVVQ